MKRAGQSAADAVFDAYPKPVRSKLLALRKLILATAKKTKGVGTIEETLKWGQPAYLCDGGSTIRIDATKAGGVALYFICTTDLVARFRELYPELSYEGNRAIHLPASGRLPEAALKHCIAMALTYKLTVSARSRDRRNPRRPSFPRPRLSR